MISGLLQTVIQHLFPSSLRIDIKIQLKSIEDERAVIHTSTTPAFTFTVQNHHQSHLAVLAIAQFQQYSGVLKNVHAVSIANAMGTSVDIWNRYRNLIRVA